MSKMDLSGRRFGRLKVIGEGEPFVNRRDLTRAWICQCDCGKVVRVRQHSLTGGSTRSCGCLFKEGQRTLTAFGKTRTISEWAKLTGISREVIHSRLNIGWAPEKAVTVPVKKKGAADTDDNT